MPNEKDITENVIWSKTRKIVFSVTCGPQIVLMGSG
jgi:hypothetical protein